MKGWASAVALVAMVGIGQPALADDLPAAKKLFAAGQTAFAIGRYLEAALDFENAYVKLPKPAFLWNAAQAYRKQFEIDGDLVNLKKCRSILENFIDLTTDSKDRAEAENRMSQIDAFVAAKEKGLVVHLPPVKKQTDEELVPIDFDAYLPSQQKPVGKGSPAASAAAPTLAASESPRPPPQPASNQSRKPPGNATPAVSVAAPAITSAPAASEPADSTPQPVYKKWWLWTAVGVAAVVLATGLGVGLDKGSGPPSTTYGNHVAPQFPK